MSTARTSHRKVKRGSRERERLVWDFAGYLWSLVTSFFNELAPLAKPGLWVPKAKLSKHVREVGEYALLARETLKKLDMRHHEVEMAIRYLDGIVSKVEELTGMVNQLKHYGDYVKISTDFALLIGGIGMDIDIVLDLLEKIPSR
jgi:hypothetical protein